MKVLMFGWEFPPHISGGLGTACYGLTKDLSKLGIDITFVLPKMREGYSKSFLKVVGAQNAIKEIRREEYRFDSESVLKQYKVDSALHPYMDKETYAEYLRQLEVRKKHGDLKEAIEASIVEMSGDDYGPDLMTEVSRYAVIGKMIAAQEDFDVIHAHDWMTYQAAVEAKKLTGKPLVVHIHATEFDRTGNNINEEIYCIEKYGLDMADKIIAVSERTKGIVVQKYGQHPDKVVVVYNGVEKDDQEELIEMKSSFGGSAFEDEKIVLFLGRITTQKGPEYFIDAADKVVKKVENVRFVMAGSGDMSKRMIEKMATLKLTDKFHFTGFLKAPEREKLFAMSDLFIMPSVSEPFGITPLEAMKHDIPVIISKQSGIGEILDHAIKVDFWDTNKLASSIIDVLSQPKKARTMVENNHKSLKAISWAKAAKEVLEVYRTV